MELDFVAKIASIILIDLVLSGDNAVVIGMAARSLPPDARKRAILFGGLGAVALRVTFTIMAALSLDIRLLQAIGGVLLIWIAYKLVRPHEDTHDEPQPRIAGIGNSQRALVGLRPRSRSHALLA